MPPRFGPCDICGGSRTIVLPTRGMGAAADFSPSAMLADSADTMQPTGGSRRYPCPECTKPVTPPEARDRYTVLRCTKVIPENLTNHAGFLDSTRGNLAALIGRNMLERGLIQTMQYKLPPSARGREDAMEAVAGAVWPDGEIIDRMIQDIDPIERNGDASYRGPGPGADPRMMFGSQPEPKFASRQDRADIVARRKPIPKSAPRSARELIFDEPPDEES